MGCGDGREEDIRQLPALCSPGAHTEKADTGSSGGSMVSWSDC